MCINQYVPITIKCNGRVDVPCSPLLHFMCFAADCVPGFYPKYLCSIKDRVSLFRNTNTNNTNTNTTNNK